MANTTREELTALLEEKEKQLAEVNEKLSAAEEKLAVAEAHHENEQSAVSATTNEFATSALSASTLAIMQKEKEKSQKKKKLFIPEDASLKSQNTYHGSLNGKGFSIPKGVEIEVPLAYAENYQESITNERKLKAALTKANGVKEIKRN